MKAFAKSCLTANNVNMSTQSPYRTVTEHPRIAFSSVKRRVGWFKILFLNKPQIGICLPDSTDIYVELSYRPTTQERARPVRGAANSWIILPRILPFCWTNETEMLCVSSSTWRRRHFIARGRKWSFLQVRLASPSAEWWNSSHLALYLTQ